MSEGQLEILPAGAEIRPFGSVYVVPCPVCGGLGSDGMASITISSNPEDMKRNLENLAEHVCRTCDGRRRVKVRIEGPA